ncbi:MAG: DUF2277 domain-containing protein [Myxococcaceae bacterium]|nr:DUF2277 domain-containing protein [Myxococcaceae bacterium]
MCRNIRRLHHFEPPATEAELHASALQYVRKLTGMNAPSKVNAKAFERAVADVIAVTKRLFVELEPHGPPRTREEEAERAKARGQKREAQLKARYGQS